MECEGMTIEPFYKCGEKYQVVTRGKCRLCKRYVWSDQPRVRESMDSKYYHEKCPIRFGGHIDEVKKWDKYWTTRAERWEKQYGKNVFVSKQMFKRAQ